MMRGEYGKAAVLLACFVLCALLSGVPALAGDAPNKPCPKPVNPGSPDPDYYLWPRSRNVDLAEDVVFAEVTDYRGNQRKLMLDVYQPSEDGPDIRPVMIWVHGGGFTSGSRFQRDIGILARDFARRGYVCFAVDYRLRDDQGERTAALRDSVEDLGRALAWVRANAGEYRLDTSRIVLAGTSTGATITNSFCVPDPANPPERDRSGIVALLTFWGTGPDPAVSPSPLDSCYPPTLIVHGTADRIIPFAQAEDFKKKLEVAGVQHRLEVLSGAPHSPLSGTDKVAWKGVQSIASLAAQFLCNAMKSR